MKVNSILRRWGPSSRDHRGVRPQDLLNRRLLEYQLRRQEIEDRPLSFPGKIEADGGRLYIADSGHNRVLVADLSGRVEQVIGTGETGAADGPLDEATFSNPQGMTVQGDKVYVADAENHNIRLVDLGAGRSRRSPVQGSNRCTAMPAETRWPILLTRLTT